MYEHTLSSGHVTHRHNSSLSFFNAFNDKDAAVLGSFHGSTVDIDQVSTLSKFSALLQLRFTNVTMQRNVFVFQVSNAMGND